MRGVVSMKRQALRSFVQVLCCAQILLVFHSAARALPMGRAWTSTQIILPADVQRLTIPRIDIDATGNPFLCAPARNSLSGPKDAIGFKWSDSSWVEVWRIGSGTNLLRPVLSHPSEYHLLWSSLLGKPSDPINTGYLITGTMIGGALGPADTVALVSSRTSAYAAAAQNGRRWVTVGDVQTSQPDLRLFQSTQSFVWHEIPVPGSGDQGTAVCALNDTSALVCWSGAGEGLRWATLSGAEWQPNPMALDGTLSIAPQLRSCPSGG